MLKEIVNEWKNFAIGPYTAYDRRLLRRVESAAVRPDSVLGISLAFDFGGDFTGCGNDGDQWYLSSIVDPNGAQEVEQGDQELVSLRGVATTRQSDHLSLRGVTTTRQSDHPPVIARSSNDVAIKSSCHCEE